MRLLGIGWAGLGMVLAGACTGGGSGAANTATSSAEVVRFRSGGLELEGTLTLPRGAGPHPAIVLVHGSGPHDRDSAMAGQLGMGFGCSISVFEELAEGLGAAGYAVLRYDKRTCGPFNGCAENGYPRPGADLVIGDLVDDAGAAIAWLSTREGVDSERIYVIGHSKGGTFAPRLLSELEALRGAVMLAAPYRPIDEVMTQQVAWLEHLLELTGTDADATLEDLHAQVDSLAMLRAGTFRGESIGGTPTAFWQSWMDLGDEAPELAVASDKPILALSGDYDWNVTPAETELWRTAFEAGDQPQHEARVLPCVTHAQNCVREPELTRIQPSDIGCHVDASVIGAIVSFLDAH